MGKAEKLERLIAAIDTYSETAYGSTDTNELSESRELAIQRYLGRNISPAPDGRSQVVDRTTYETIEWMKPSLLRIFAGSDDVIKFEPEGPEDEDQAQQESDYVNYVVTQKNNWHQICHDWFTDALLLKNGYAYACWDETKSTESEFYENLTDDGMAMLINDDVDVVAHSSRVDEKGLEAARAAFAQQMAQYQQMMMQAPPGAAMGGQLPPPPQEPQVPMLHDVEIKRTNQRGKVSLHVLAPERCRIDIKTPNFTLDECNYFEWFDVKTIGQIRAMGLNVPDDISDTTELDNLDITEENARDLYGEDSSFNRNDSFEDASMRRVKIRYIWIRHDFNEDGIDEYQYVIRIGKEILFRQECSGIPVSSISPVPLPHRHVGMSIADTVADIEDVNTAFIRQGIDNLFLANNPRTFVSDRVNMSDLLDSRVGGIVRVEGQPPQEVMPYTVPDIFPQAMQAIQFFDARRQNRTGINAYFQGTDANTLNKTASGISQLTNSAAQRVEMIARLFSPGVERLFRITHELLLKHGRSKETIKLKNKWIEVNPSEWRNRYNLKLIVGLGTGNKDSLLGQLANMFQMQMAALPVGAVTPQNIYHTLKEMSKAASFTSPEQFATEPGPPQPPQKPLELQMKEMELQVEQAKIAATDKGKTDQIQFQVWQAKQQQMLDMWKMEQDQKLQIALAQIKNDSEDKKLGLEAHKFSTDLENKQKEKQESEEEMIALKTIEEIKAMQMDGFGQMNQAIASLAQQISMLTKVTMAEKQIIRDKAGRPIGAKPILSDEDASFFSQQQQIQ